MRKHTKLLSALLAFILSLTCIYLIPNQKNNIYAASSITKADIDRVCQKYGISHGRYWTYDYNNVSNTVSALDAAAKTGFTASDTPYGDKYGSSIKDTMHKGEYFYNGYRQCWGMVELLGREITGKSPTTAWTHYTSISEVTNAGGVQVGDVIHSSSHTAMVISVSGSTFKVIECWGSERSKNRINVGEFNDNYDTISSIPNFEWLARYNGTVIPVPSNTWITASCGLSTTIGTSVTLKWGAPNAASYWLHIYKDGSDYYNEGQSSRTSWTHTFSKAGKYVCYITPYGKADYISSSEGPNASVTITVTESNPTPSGTWITASCGSSTTTGTSVTLNWGAPNAASYWLHIYKDGSDYYNEGQSGRTSWTHTFSKAGKYVCYITPYGKTDYISSSEGPNASVTITVTDPMPVPTNGWLKTSSDFQIKTYEPFTLSWGAENATYYRIKIINQNATTIINENYTQTSIEMYFTDLGTYTIYMYPYNSSGKGAWRATQLYVEEGWVNKDSAWSYYFDGDMVKGWIKDGENWYYMAPDTGIMKTGWVSISGKWYYMNSSGVMQTGWQKISGIWYYFESSGAMATGWKQLSDKWYYFDRSGTMASGWKQISGTWYYFESLGAMVSGWKQIGGTWYYFESSGAMAKNWKQIGGSWYYFGSSGAMVTGWKQISGKWYYFYDSGKMATNTIIDGYKIGKDGVMV